MQIDIHITDLIDTLTDVKIDVKILELSLIQGRRFKKILQYCPKKLKIERRAVFWRRVTLYFHQCWNPLLSQLLSVNRIQLSVWAFLVLTLLLSNDFILFWHFHKKICLKTFFEDKHFDLVNAFGPNTFQPWFLFFNVCFSTKCLQ